MRKFNLLLLSLMALPQTSQATSVNCEKHDQIVKIKLDYAKDWSDRIPEMLTMARVKLGVEPTSKSSAEYLEISNLVKTQENPFIAMGLKNGDRIYGTENLTFDGKNDLQFYTYILGGRSHCLKIERGNEIKIIKYVLTLN